MANPKINTILSFATKGVSGVTNDVKSVTSGVDSATSAVDKLSSRISSIQKGVAFQSVVTAASAVKNMFSAVADTVESAVSAVYGLAYSQAAAADAIGKTSALMGMQVGELQALRSAGMHAGMSLESVDSALQKFSVNTGKAAAGEKTQIALFNALGVATKNADGSIRSQTELLMDVADAYSKLTDSQDRNRVSQELFGRGGVQMSALLKNGSKGIVDAVTLYERTNAGYTLAQALAAEAFNDQLQTMREYISGIRKDLFFALVPAFTKMFDGVASFIDKNRPKIDSIVNKLSDKLPKVIDDVTSALPVVLTGVSAVASGVGSIVDFTGPWVPILTAAGAIIGGTILTAVGAVGAAVATIGPAFGAAVVAAAPIVGIVGTIGTGVASIGVGLYKISHDIDNVFSAFINGVASSVKAVVNDTIVGFQSIISVFEKIPLYGKIFSGVSSLLESAKFNTSNFLDVSQKDLTSGFDFVPPGQANSSDVTGVNASTFSSLTVDFRGVPRGTKITPSANFDYGNIDYSAGYAFGGS